MTGTCGKCGKPVRYVTTSTRGLWVHADTGHSIDGRGDDRHDANTHVRRD